MAPQRRQPHGDGSLGEHLLRALLPLAVHEHVASHRYDFENDARALKRLPEGALSDLAHGAGVQPLLQRRRHRLDAALALPARAQQRRQRRHLRLLLRHQLCVAPVVDDDNDLPCGRRLALLLRLGCGGGVVRLERRLPGRRC